MAQQYMVIRGLTPSVVFRSGLPAPAAAEILQFQNEQMKSTVKGLLAAGVPLRQMLRPYVDTVLMDDKTPVYYFGSTLILYGDEAQLVEAAGQTGITDSTFAVKLLPDAAAVNRFLSRDVPVTKMHTWPMVLRRTFQEDIQLSWYTFPTERLTRLGAYPMDHRAVNRAVLAFGDILGRAVRKLGGQVLYCAGADLICVWPAAEPAEAQPVLQKTFETQLAQVIGAEGAMKRRVFGPEAAV